MAQYFEFKTKRFKLKKDATAWAKRVKAENKAAGQQMKIETNYLSNSNEWEGIVLRKM